MANLQFPGVYVQTLPGGVGPILSAPTNTTLFVGVSETGPLNTPTLVTSWNQYVATFGGLVWGGQMPFAVFAFFAEGGGACYVVRAEAGGPAPATLASLTAGPLTISAAIPGAWGDSLAVTISDVPPSTAPGGAPSPVFAINVFYNPPAKGVVPTVIDDLFASYVATNPLMSQTIGGLNWVLLESFSGFTAADLQSGAAGLSNIEIRINQTSLFIRVAVTGTTRPPNLAQPTMLSGGGGDAAPGSVQLATALAALDSLTDVSLLCVPDTVLIADLGLQRAALQQVVTWCEARPRRDLFYIADSPFGLSAPDVDAFKTGAASADGLVPSGVALQSPLGALYYPWITILNPGSTTTVPIAPSGAMAGLYVAADNAVGPWRVAAGINLGALSLANGVTQAVTDSDQDILNPDGVNAIRTIINYGVCAYGGRTMASNSISSDPEQIYISVRRLLTMIEQSVYIGLQWVAFESNSPGLWASVTRQVGLYLTNLWQSGGLFGSTAAEAFSVQCDATNNPLAAQGDGLLNVDIMVAPVRPAEFVVLRIQVATLAGS